MKTVYDLFELFALVLTEKQDRKSTFEREKRKSGIRGLISGIEGGKCGLMKRLKPLD